MIELRSGGMSYDGAQILSGITCTFHPRDFTCMIGKNGCGKSTLLRAAAGLMPYTGSILLNGQEVSAIPKQKRARQISYLPQLRPVPSMDVETLIAHGRYPHLGFSKTLTTRDREEIEQAALVAGVADLLRRSVAALSGGERQRAYIAMAVAQDADMMLLDEPTAYLDIAHQLEVMELLTRLHKRGKGIVVVAHDLPQAFHYANRILLLGQGTVLGGGSPDEIASGAALPKAMGVCLKKTTGADGLYTYRFVKGGGT